MDYFKNDFFFRDEICNEINFGTKMEIDPKCRDEIGVDQYFKILLVFMFLSVYWIFLVIEVSL